jgi:DNA-binding beta-propeller fold protein YncE
MKQIVFLLSIFLVFQGCTYDKEVVLQTTPNNGYPKEIAAIVINKCATSGCHDDISKDAASGLNLISWDKMFEGTNTGPVVIPYRADQSTAMYFTNTYPEYGISLMPKMPINLAPLNKDEIKLLNDWILRGAPNDKGFVKFSDNPNRKKIYISNQSCDLVDVIDEETGLIMRSINVGADPQTIEYPHMIRVSPDGQFWYVVFYNSTVVQKYRTSDESFVGQVDIGQGLWNTIAISDDSKSAFVVNWTGNGTIAYINLETMTKIVTYTGYTYPHQGYRMNNNW